MFGRGLQRAGPSASPRCLPRWAVRTFAIAGVLLVVATMTWLWKMTRSVVPEEHARIDSALRELRSLDRVVNQDVLKARLQINDSYDPVRRSYRRIEQLERLI